METIVLYKSKSGFVKKYAEWIATDLDADLAEASCVSIKTLSNYKTIIYGGGLYAIGINGIRLITRNIMKLKDKNIIVFASGASPLRHGLIEEIELNNFTMDQLKFVKVFYMRGGFMYDKLSFVDKILMDLFQRKLKRKSNLNLEEIEMLAAYEVPVDFTRKENIAELKAYVAELNDKEHVCLQA